MTCKDGRNKCEIDRVKATKGAGVASGDDIWVSRRIERYCVGVVWSGRGSIGYEGEERDAAGRGSLERATRGRGTVQKRVRVRGTQEGTTQTGDGSA